MATKLHSRPQGLIEPGTHGYEPRDANVTWIFAIILFLLGCGFIIHLLLAVWLNHLKNGSSITDAWRPIPRPSQQSLASFPRLQISPQLDLNEFRAREDAELTNYGWINQASGVVRVPVSRAMELVLEKGLPTRPNSGSRGGPSPLELINKRALNRESEIQGNQ
jgi:hypothetical protein